METHKRNTTNILVMNCSAAAIVEFLDHLLASKLLEVSVFKNLNSSSTPVKYKDTVMQSSFPSSKCAQCETLFDIFI